MKGNKVMLKVSLIVDTNLTYLIRDYTYTTLDKSLTTYINLTNIKKSINITVNTYKDTGFVKMKDPPT